MNFEQACAAVPTPCHLLDLGALRRNLGVLDRVQREAGCTILLALKGFAQWSAFGTVSPVLGGVTASSPDEARLGREKFGKEVHVYAPAYARADIDTIAPLADHVVFNSVAQWQRFGSDLRAVNPKISCGLRVNPEHSEVKTPLYDPCAPGSRLGVRREDLDPSALEGIEGLHFHTLCELGADALERTLAAFEAKFGAFVPQMKWVNMGGGHHITRADYEVGRLIALLQDFRRRHPGVQVYLEPGEAIALDTGVLVAAVLDLLPAHEGLPPVAILDTSATAHMPDVLEMPYRPRIVGAGDPGAKPHTYRLGGLTCLAGDVIGDWSFDTPLAIGDRLIFEDMAHYTMVKNTTFNGVRLPSIANFDPQTGEVDVVRRFGYEDYASRLS